jgi:hypothetical protein
VKWPTVVSNIDYENCSDFEQILFIYASTTLHRFSIPINKVFIVCSACHLLSLLFLFSAYSSILKMEATCSSEMSIDFHRTTRRYIPEDGNLSDHLSENLTFYIYVVCVIQYKILPYIT